MPVSVPDSRCYPSSLLSRVDVRPSIHPSPIALLKDFRGATAERFPFSLTLHRDLHQRIEDRHITEILNLRPRKGQGHQFPLMFRECVGSRQKFIAILPVLIRRVHRYKVVASQLPELRLIVEEVALPD